MARSAVAVSSNAPSPRRYFLARCRGYVYKKDLVGVADSLCNYFSSKKCNRSSLKDAICKLKGSIVRNCFVKSKVVLRHLKLLSVCVPSWLTIGHDCISISCNVNYATEVRAALTGEANPCTRKGVAASGILASQNALLRKPSRKRKVLQSDQNVPPPNVAATSETQTAVQFSVPSPPPAPPAERLPVLRSYKHENGRGSSSGNGNAHGDALPVKLADIGDSESPRGLKKLFNQMQNGESITNVPN